MKKIISILLVLVSLVTLTACTVTDKQTPADTVTDETTTAPDPTEPSTEETTEPATEETTEPSSEETTEPATEETTEPSSEETTEPATEETTESTADDDEASTADGWQSYYDENDQLYAKELYQDGEPIDTIWYEDGEETYRTALNREDDQITVSFYQYGELNYVKTWDTEGKPIVYTNYVSGKPVWRNTFTYDDNGNLSDYHSDVLNQQGNPLRKISLQGGSYYGDGVYGDEYFEGGVEQWCRSYTYASDGTLLNEQKEDIITGEYSYRLFYFYDEAGHLAATFNAQTGQEYEARYDEQGRIIQEIEYCDPELSSTDYSYDENGLKTGYFTGATYGSADTIYNEQDQLILNIFYGDGEEENRTEYEYNDQGDIIREICTDALSEGVETHTYEYTYREDGAWSEKICFRNGEEESRVIRVYDEAGLLVEETDGDCTTTFTYNGSGLLIREDKTYEDSQWNNYKLYSYDDFGRLTEEICIFS